MKRLTTLVLAALLSLGVVSLSLAQEAPAAGGQPAAAGEAAQAGKATKKPKKKHAKKSGKKHKKKEAPAAAEETK
jgi:hypothetical protein